MRKCDIPKLANNDLITEYVLTYSMLLLNFNSGRGTKQYEGQCKALQAELLKREILTPENINELAL